MMFLRYQSYIKNILKNYRSCSLVNSEGALLYSKDNNSDLLTTTRLVAFQIVKKYLNPKPLDLFVLNDPENGGFQFSKLLFITCLTPNLFLIWDEDYHYIDFKIPPTPLYDLGMKNEFVWKALVESNKFAAELKYFFELQKSNLDRIISSRSQIDLIANPKNQQLWLKATQEIFSIQFGSKAHGSYEGSYRLMQNQFIKLKLSAEEKQNLKLITLDFTNTNLATEIHSSSHVAESAIVKKIIDFYQIGDFFTQSILDKIKVILPPRSIVSKSHPTGQYNYELQAICAQLCDYNLQQMNSHARKPQSSFEYAHFLHFDIHTENCFSSNLFSAQTVNLENFETLINDSSIHMSKMKKADSVCHLKFEVTAEKGIKISIKNIYYSEKSPNFIKLNDLVIQRGVFSLSKGDQVEVYWG